MKKLDFGCGQFKKPGYISVDNNALTKPDILMDLNNTKDYSRFKTGQYDEVRMSHLLEHLDDPLSIMSEIHRILKKGGKAVIIVPHFSRGFTHPQHKAGFDVSFPLYFDKNFKGGYYGVDFKKEKVRLNWMSQWYLKKSLMSKPTLFILKIMSSVISFFANTSPYFCSRFWCYLVGGFEEVEFVLVKK